MNSDQEKQINVGRFGSHRVEIATLGFEDQSVLET